MGRIFKYEYPFPISVNHYWDKFRYSVTISKRGRKFRQEVIALSTKIPYTSKELKVEVGYVRPDERIRDLDNYQKSLFDAMKHARVYHDDKQIVDLRLYWLGLDPMRIGSSIVTIEELI